MIEIPDTPKKELLTTECEHLSPIVRLLEENGNKADRETGVLHDVGEGNFLLFYEPVNTDLIRKKVKLPDFIKIINNEYLFCERCWFTLEQRKKDKMFNGPVHIKW